METDPPTEDHEPGGYSGGGVRSRSSEKDPRGGLELCFVGEEDEEAEQEVDESDLGPEFDSYEDLAGDKLRLLDR